MHTHLATFLFQIVNFLVLAGVLRFWLYRPVQAMIARRQKEVEAPLAAAAADRAQAAEIEAQAERQLAAAAGARDRFLLEARHEAEARRDQLLADAQRKAAELAEAGRQGLDRERAGAESQLRSRAAELAVGLAARLLATAASPDATRRLLEEALSAVEAMDGTARTGGAARTAGPARVEVVTAVAVEAADRDAIAARLRQALGGAADVAFAEDPALLAGAEIHLPTAVVRQSWRDQLARAQRELVGP